FRRRLHAQEAELLREELAVYAAGRSATLAAARPELPAGIEDRHAAMWEPLLAVADAAGGEWPVEARRAAVALVAAARDTEPSFGLRLLSDIRLIFDQDRLPTATILSRLHALEEAPWKELKRQPLNDRRLAKLLNDTGSDRRISVSATNGPRATS